MTKRISEDAMIALPGEDKFSALKALVDSSPAFSSLDRAKLLSAVFSREKEQSTYIGHGVSIAHGKMDGLDKTLIALGISKDGISGDSEPIHLLFVIASPINNPGCYLRTVAAILSWIHIKKIRDKLCLSDRNDPDVIAFISMLRKQKFIDYFKAEGSHLGVHQLQ